MFASFACTTCFNRHVLPYPIGAVTVAFHIFDPCSGHMWESQVLLTDGQVVFPRFSGFRPPLMNDRLDVSELFLKGP